MRERPPPSAESVKDGILRLIRTVEALKSEVRAVRERLGQFTKDRDLSDPYILIPGQNEDDGGYAPITPERFPSALKLEFSDTSDFETPTRAIIAIGKDLNGALSDIRATRADINAIANDSDLRAEFKTYFPD
jgi:hypothetical protein